MVGFGKQRPLNQPNYSYKVLSECLRITEIVTFVYDVEHWQTESGTYINPHLLVQIYLIHQK